MLLSSFGIARGNGSRPTIPHPRTEAATNAVHAVQSGMRANEGLRSRLRSKRLLGTGEVEGRILQEPASVVDLDDVSVAGKLSRAALRDILLAGVLGEAPLGGLEDLPAAGKLELSPAAH